MLILSVNDSKLLCYFKINRRIFIDDKVVYVSDMNYDNTKSYSIESIDLEDIRMYGGASGEAAEFVAEEPQIENYDILLYKYQDPVVRMVCEYVILLINYFFTESNNINIIYDKLIIYKQLTRGTGRFKYTQEIRKNKFWEFVRKIFMGKTPGLNPRPSVQTIDGLEGKICKFGFGKTNCCENTLNTFLDEGQFLQYRTNELFNIDLFTTLKQDLRYKEYQDLSQDGQYKELYENPQNFLNPTISEPERDIKQKFVEICQAVIDIIIMVSGRAEGGGDATDNSPEIDASSYIKPYPPISVLEVFDLINKHEVNTYVWIIRSERFHLAKSPCVHFGLQGSGITDRLTKFFCLEKSYTTNVILHSIGHCLDRLYCGHTHSGNYIEDNEVIFGQIFRCFEIFLSKMKEKNTAEPGYDDENFNKINIENFDKIILYLVSINDQVALEKYIEDKKYKWLPIGIK